MAETGYLGCETVTVLGTPQTEALHNISGDNWPQKPSDTADHVTYCYISTPTYSESIAEQEGATLRTESVRTEDDRTAHLIYHPNGEDKNFVEGAEIVVSSVLETKQNDSGDKKYLHLVYSEDFAQPAEADLRSAESFNN